MFLCICLCAYQHICILCTSICVLNHPWFRLTTWLASPINWYPTRIGVFYRPHYSLLILCHHKRGNWLFVFGYLYLCLYRTASSTEYVLFRTAIGIHNGPRDRYHICPDRQKHDGCHYYQLIRSLNRMWIISQTQVWLSDIFLQQPTSKK